MRRTLHFLLLNCIDHFDPPLSFSIFSPIAILQISHFKSWVEINTGQNLINEGMIPRQKPGEFLAESPGDISHNYSVFSFRKQLHTKQFLMQLHTVSFIPHAPHFNRCNAINSLEILWMIQNLHYLPIINHRRFGSAGTNLGADWSRAWGLWGFCFDSAFAGE